MKKNYHNIIIIIAAFNKERNRRQKDKRKRKRGEIELELYIIKTEQNTVSRYPNNNNKIIIASGE